LHPLRSLVQAHAPVNTAAAAAAASLEQASPPEPVAAHELLPLAALLPPSARVRLVGCLARLTAAARATASRLERGASSSGSGGTSGGSGVPLNPPMAESVALLVALLEAAVAAAGTDDGNGDGRSDADSRKRPSALVAGSGSDSDNSKSSERKYRSDHSGGSEIGQATRTKKPRLADGRGAASKRHCGAGSGGLRAGTSSSSGASSSGGQVAEKPPQQPPVQSDVRFWAGWLAWEHHNGGGSSSSSGSAASKRAAEALADGELLADGLRGLRTALSRRSQRRDKSAWGDDEAACEGGDGAGVSVGLEDCCEAACQRWLHARLVAALEALAAQADGSGFQGTRGEAGAWGVSGGGALGAAAPAQGPAPWAGGGLGRQRRGRAARLRSRNRVVDAWLEDEDGRDAYADLEGFIVD
jgi:hypothetical protein